MQKKEYSNFLQTKRNPKNAKNKRKNLRSVSKLHKQNERIIISLVYNNEIEIDDHGRIWRIKVRKGMKNGGICFYPVKKRRAERKVTKGYLQVRAMINGKRYNASAHRLVWHYFFGPIPFGITINHKNGIKDDNNPKNLELLTLSDNMKHAHKIGLINQYGEKNPAAKLSNRQIVEIRSIYSKGGYTQKDLAIKYGVVSQTISDIVRGKCRKKQGGQIKDYSYRKQINTKKDPISGRFI